MTNVFHGLNIAKKRISKVESILIEISQTKSQRKAKKNIFRKSRNCEAVAKDTPMMRLSETKEKGIEGMLMITVAE